MARLRYIVDNPRGPRGGNHDDPYLYRSLESAVRSAGERPKAVVRSDGTVLRRTKPQGRVLVVDIDLAMPEGATPDEEFAYHERALLHHGAEVQRLRAQAELPTRSQLSSADMARIREAVSEWVLEEDRLRRGGGATPAARAAFFLMWGFFREGKLG